MFGYNLECINRNDSTLNKLLVLDVWFAKAHKHINLGLQTFGHRPLKDPHIENIT